MKVGILFNNFAPRFIKEKAYFEEKIASYGGEAIVKCSDGSDALQEDQAKELFNEGIDALIIIASNVNTAASIVRQANDKGIKVIAYDRLVRNCDLDLFVSFDGVKTGELLAKYAIDKFPKGNYVLLNGDKSDDNSAELYKGTLKVLQPLIDNKDINVVYTGFVDGWSGENAAFLTNRILEFCGTTVDVIISQYDGLSDGITQALASRKLTGEILVTGQDAEIPACSRIINNEQAMTVYKPVKIMATQCIDLVFELLNNDGVKSTTLKYNGRIQVPTVLFDPVAVDANNIEQTVIADDFLSRKEIESYQQN